MELGAKEQPIVLIDPQDISQVEVIDSGTNRSSVFSSHEGMLIHKPESRRELENFRIVERYRAKLVEKGVCFPLLISLRLANQGGSGELVMASFPYFEPYNIEEHFGRFQVFEEERVMRAYLKSLRTIADVIPASEFEGRREDEEGLIETIEMLGEFASFIEDDTNKVVPYEVFYEIVEKTQIGLSEVGFVAHKDANPSNWRAVLINDRIYINYIDLETLGCARPGWDEGRAFVLFSLDPNKQKMILGMMSEEKTFQNKNAMEYFWRVVVLRSLRELYLLRSGKYDAPLLSHTHDAIKKEDLKEEIVNSVLETLRRGIKELT